MNSSGEAVIEFKNFYKLDLKNIIIVYDDIDLKQGEIRVRRKGSAGSHNGMKSVEQFLSSNEFPRVRVRNRQAKRRRRFDKLCNRSCANRGMGHPRTGRRKSF